MLYLVEFRHSPFSGIDEVLIDAETPRGAILRLMWSSIVAGDDYAVRQLSARPLETLAEREVELARIMAEDAAEEDEEGA